MSGYGSLSRGGSSSQAFSPLSTLQDALYALASLLPCCADLSGRGGGAGSALGGSGGGDGGSGGAVPGGTALKLNGRAVVLVRLLGEGAVSFVYLARDRESGREFALKVMRCPSGTPTLRLALSEIETTRRFRSPHTIRLLDSCVEQTADGHVVYLFLPLCRGTLQDALAARAVRGETADEASSLRLFRGAAEGLKSMHTWRLPDVGAQPGAAPAGEAEAGAPEDEEHGEEDERRLLPGQDDSGEAAYPPKPPRMESSAVPSSDGPVGKGGDPCAWAHRDIKPANIMIAPSTAGSGEPLAVIMDFGSACRARIEIKSRREAIIQQDVAAEHSSMPYRAPELFDVKTDAVLDEKVDIWSLGCTYYAMLYGYSPFETPQLVEQGGSIAMAVQSGSWKFPDAANASFSEASKEIIRRCLVLDPRQRADIHEVLELTDKAIAALQ